MSDEWLDDFGAFLRTAQVARARRLLNALGTWGEQAPGAISGLQEVAAALSGDLAAAVAAAEESLTGLGRRKLAVA